jgi:aminodeoxyfutalosine synthase
MEIAPPASSATRASSPELARIEERVRAGERLTDADALALFRCPDLNFLGRLADLRRAALNGGTVTYLRNRYINYSNICILSCQFCSFYRRRRDPDAWEHAIPEMVEKAREAVAAGCTELHIVGGLHPTLDSAYYLDMLRGLREAGPGLHLKVFTAIEIRHLAERVFRKPIPEVLAELREAGLGSLTGGGAEIFDPAVRDRLCRGKETAEEWMEVHRLWHGMGGRSTCTMLYGHVETPEHRVDHLRRLRALQDETGGFTGFIPLPYQPEDNELKGIPRCAATEDLRTIAVARLYLDNVRHVTAYWIGLGAPLAQVALGYGADDLHGTIMEEHIFHMAGATTPQGMTVPELERLIREAGREPRQRDSHYERL